VLPERFRQSPEDFQRAVQAYKRRQRQDLNSGRVRASTVRSIGLNPETGNHTCQVQRHGGPWSEPEVIQPEVIEAERRRNPRWRETERRAAAALRDLRRAERLLRGVRVVPSARLRGRYEHRPGHRRTTASRGPPDDGDGDEPDGDGDVPAPGVARAFSRPRGGTLRHVSVAPDAFVGDMLPELYTFAEHRRRCGHLSPSGQLAAFLTLPEWQCQQAWRSLRAWLQADREASGSEAAR
jgi:hypothetical protein